MNSGDTTVNCPSRSGMAFSEFSTPPFEQLQLWDIGDKCGVPRTPAPEPSESREPSPIEVVPAQCTQIGRTSKESGKVESERLYPMFDEQTRSVFGKAYGIGRGELGSRSLRLCRLELHVGEYPPTIVKVEGEIYDELDELG